jgi:hypothetical protein
MMTLSELNEKINKEFDLQFFEEGAKNISIESENSAKQALSMALQSRKIVQSLEKSRVEIIRPHLNYQRAVNKIITDLKLKLESMQDSLQGKIKNWALKQKDNPFLCVDELKVEDGSFYLKEEWRFFIEDPKIVPDCYKIVNENEIEMAIQNGLRDIPGVKIFKNQTSHMRVKNL